VLFIFYSGPQPYFFRWNFGCKKIICTKCSAIQCEIKQDYADV
jgi:hypothetical protein